MPVSDMQRTGGAVHCNGMRDTAIGGQRSFETGNDRTLGQEVRLHDIHDCLDIFR